MRTIEYTVGVDKINPFTVQFAGYAGEDNVTTLKFTLDSELMNCINSYGSGIFYALEVRNSEGMYDVYPLQCDANGSSTVLQFMIPKEVKSLSGRVVMQLSVVKLDSNNIQERKLFAYPLRLRFDPSVSGGAEGTAEVERYESGVISAMRRAERAAEEASDYASESEGFTDEASKYADEATGAAETAKHILEQLHQTPHVIRGETTEYWETNNPVLLKYEMGVEFTADGKIKEKIGDGTHTWNDLEYVIHTTSDLDNNGDGESPFATEMKAYYQASKFVSDNYFKSITDEMGDDDVYGIPMPSAVVKYVTKKDKLTEKSANRTDTINAESPSNIKYPSEKAVVDYVLEKAKGPTWQLLAEYTAEEDLPYTSLIEYGVTASESAAVPLNLSGIRVYTSAPATGATIDSDMVFRYFDANGSRKIAIYATGFLSKSGVANGMIEMKNSDGLWDTRVIQPTAITGVISNIQGMSSGNYATISSAAFPAICGITISTRNAAANIPAGTSFKIWGLK